MRDGDRVLFLGDSLIAYYEWQEFFSQYECVNLGVPGETVAGWQGLTAQAFKRYPKAHCLVLMLGANNLCQQDYSFLGDYEVLVDGLRRLYPEAEIVVCSLLPHRLPWLAETAIPRLNEMLGKQVVRRGDIFLDLYTPFRAESDDCFLEDGVHLAEMGYKVWCTELNTFWVAEKDDGVI